VAGSVRKRRVGKVLVSWVNQRGKGGFFMGEKTETRMGRG
jgi:hypothetical protein